VLTQKWLALPEKKFVNNVFWIAFAIRFIWVTFSFFFYLHQTGIPFEWSAADSLAYYEDSVWLSNENWNVISEYLFSTRAYSDSGYNLYLIYLYKLIGPCVYPPRVVKAFLSAITCVLLYKLAKRNFGESTGRMAAVFCMFMPNMIYYCGLHLKETEMVFLIVSFLERADYLLRGKHYTIVTIVLVLLLAFSLFLFRTALGAVAVFAFFTGLLFTSTKIVRRSKKVLLIIWGVAALAFLAGGAISTEVEELWNDRSQNQQSKRIEQTLRGNRWAKYATGTVMAPMIFVVPYSTMVDVDCQYNQQLIHGGNFVKNLMGIFIILAFAYSLFVKKNWRDFSLIGAFTIGYLLIIASSGFANSERFLFPALPGLMMMWAYGVSLVNSNNLKYVNAWFYLVIIMEFSWAFYKLGSRGLIG
jgi:Alg9-like mannosyltransferase family.